MPRAFLRTFVLVAAVASLAAAQDEPSPSFQGALEQAERALGQGRLEEAARLSERALERDRRSPAAWAQRAKIALARGDADLAVHALHTELRLLERQGAEKALVAARLAELAKLDPLAEESFKLRSRYIGEFLALAREYEKDERPHGAIRVLKQVLALDSEHALAQESIERIAARPDPSLAADAKPADLFADVTREWIEEHDAKHAEWSEAARAERPNYFTVTNAGYEVLIRTAEAMEQMSAFYKRFFRYGSEEDSRSVPRITVHVFKDRAEYLAKGIGPPVEWSGGHFTGSHVECYIGDGGFEGMVGTLFHEAAHQYVSLATQAVGWLNEGLASFFEGTRILPNGTVVMNLPADHRLFPLAERIKNGWMANPQDGYDPNDPSSQPTKAPTWRILVENRYEWGPAWYAPTWGIVYFCYNFQDPRDGRFVYRDAFWEFVNRSGGKVGEGAVETFEEVVLQNPMPPYPGQAKERDDGFALPATVAALDEVWKEWILALAEERSGRLETARPYKQWARLAVAAKAYDTARDHFERGLVAAPDDVELMLEFADLLAQRFKDEDRAAKLVLDALRELEAAEPRDAAAVAAAEQRLERIDPKRKSAAKLQARLAADAVALVGRYEAAGLDAMVQDLAWRFGSQLGLPELYARYEDALRARGAELAVWELAYDEVSLEGWLAGSDAFEANGVHIIARNGSYDPDSFTYQTLTLDRVTAGDFSLEAEVSARPEGASFAGFIFGSKGNGRFHGALLLPARAAKEGAARTAFVDLMTSFGGDETKAWRHLPVGAGIAEAGSTSAGAWNLLRVDVVGNHVDLWWDGELLTTHEFPDREVLQGRLGLIVGNGEARFRNVRFLARDPRDPAGRILRRVRTDELAARGEPVGGSYLGLAPPAPKVARWLWGDAKRAAAPAAADGATEPGAAPEFEGFGALPPAPELLVLWSIDQNELVPIDAWLRWLAEEWSDVGLRIVSVASPNDDARIEAYLAEKPFPGLVGVDRRPEGTAGIGETFEAYSILRFNLPRLVLIDVDGRVAWEGDPGFAIGETYVPPYDTYLDAPLAELVEKRKLRRLAEWRKSWQRASPAAIASGDLAALLPMMRAARELDAPYDPDARAAVARLELLETATADLAATGALLEERGLSVAFDAFVREWLPILGREVTRAERKDVTKLQKHRSLAHFERAAKAAAKAEKAGDVLAAAALLEAELASLEGAFVRDFAAEVGAAAAAGDERAVRALLGSFRGRPQRWLIANYLGG